MRVIVTCTHAFIKAATSGKQGVPDKPENDVSLRIERPHLIAEIEDGHPGVAGRAEQVSPLHSGPK